MSEKLNAVDTINGKEGIAYAKIDGENRELFFARTIEAIIEKTKAQVKSIGKRMVGNKTTGLAGTGSMSLYYMQPDFRRLIKQYLETGVDIYFDMVVINDDPSSAAGRQTTLVQGVNLDSTVIAKLDGDTDDPLDEDCDFTFEGYKVLEHFNSIN